MATQPCNTCQLYDPIIRGKTAGRHGRCVATSTYPTVEQAGQVFPPGAVRVRPGQRPKPVIVVGTDVVTRCARYHALPPAKRSKP